MEVINCDLCGSQDARVLVVQKDIVHGCAPPSQDFSLQQCQRCGLVYLNPPPDLSEAVRYYPESYEFYSARRLMLYKAREFLTHIISNNYLNRLLALLAFPPLLRDYFVKLVQPRKTDYLRLMKPCRLLDVGCGSGLNTHFWGYSSSIHALKKRGFEVVGLEYAEKAREIAHAHGLTAVSSFAQLEGQVFDCIRMNWSLEHVDSPAKFFEASRRLLKPKGKLIIAVPNYDGILYKLYPHCVEVPVHTYYFTPQTLENYLEKYEFEVVDRFTFSYPGMFVFASKILGHKPRFILSPLQSIYFQSILNQFDHQMLGNDMVYLSQKK